MREEILGFWVADWERGAWLFLVWWRRALVRWGREGTAGVGGQGRRPKRGWWRGGGGGAVMAGGVGGVEEIGGV